jgi:hypothetical protein
MQALLGERAWGWKVALQGLQRFILGIWPIPGRSWSWIYADPGTMPRRVQCDTNASDGVGLWGWLGLRCSA